MTDRIMTLDCTLRDGGFALEDAYKNDIRPGQFTKQERDTIKEHMEKAGLDIIEIGAVEKTGTDKTGFAIYNRIEDAGSALGKKNDDVLYAVFYRGPDISMDEIPDRAPGLPDITRVCIRYSELEKSLDFCEGLCKKGYKVFIQPMVTVRYTREELTLLANRANDMGAYALYFVDSYGYMTPEDVKAYFDFYDSILRDDIRIGFHAHNNMEMAFANVLEFISCSGARNIVIDSCASGMGQGTGNLQTEVILNYLNNAHAKSYKTGHVYEVCELIDKYNEGRLWGYHPVRFIPAANKTAYKFAMALKNNYDCSYREIDEILSDIPESMRYRYTPDDTKKLIAMRNGEV